MQESTDRVTPRATTNDNMPTIEDPSAKLRRVATYGRLWEISAVTSLAAIALLYGLGFWGWFFAGAVPVLLLACGWSVKKAVDCAVKAAGLEQQVETRASALKYRVTETRLRTLEEARVPVDVMRVLKLVMNAHNLNGKQQLSEEQFLKLIAEDHDLGWARTNEFRETILKYTVLDAKIAPISPKDEPPNT